MKTSQDELKTLRKTIQKYKIIFDSVADGILVQDLKGKCVFANDAGAKMCGFNNAEEFINATVKDVIEKYKLVDRDGNPLAREDLPAQQVLSGRQEAPDLVMGTVDSHSNIKWSLVKSRPVYDEEGNVYLAVSIFRDITEQRKSSAELKTHIEQRTQELTRSKQFLDSVIEYIPNMIFVKDAKDLRFVRFNKAGEDLLGFSREELLGKNDYDFFTQEQADFFISKDRDVIKFGKLVDIPEEAIKTKTGERLLHTKKIPIFDDSGKPEYLLGISEDITEVKKSEQQRAALFAEQMARIEAEKAADRLEFLSSASKVLSESLDYKVTMNSVAKLAVSYLADWCSIDIIEPGKENPVSVALAHPDPKKMAWAEKFKKYPLNWERPTGIVRVLRTGEPEIYDRVTDQLLMNAATSPEHLQIMRELGMKSVMIVPLKLGSKILGTISFIFAESGRSYTDSDLKLATELASRAALAIDNARLYRLSENEIAEREKAVKARDEFLSIASHELRTPLTALYLQLQMLQRSAKKNVPLDMENLVSKLDLSTRQAAQLGELIDGLLDVSRIGAGRIKIHKGKVDFVELLNEIVTRFNPSSKISGSEIKVKAQGPMIGFWDKMRLSQAITNLLSNALKYGGGKPIEVVLKSSGSMAVMEVKDQGIGIAPEDQDRVFERFERAVSHTNISGMGLGLYITREIAEVHGGTVRVQSVPGKGSVFTMQLPLEAGEGSHARSGALELS